MHSLLNLSEGIPQLSVSLILSLLQHGCRTLLRRSNLSETAFVFPGNECRIIRFYTPESEVQLCGHATLSASHILYETGIVKKSDEILYSSGAGELTVRKRGSWIIMNSQ